VTNEDIATLQEELLDIEYYLDDATYDNGDILPAVRQIVVVLNKIVASLENKLDTDITIQ